MSDSTAPTEGPEHLLLHGDFVRRLARQLLRDSNAAEDIVQQTWLATMRRPPGEPTAPRSWLATIVRRLVQRYRRGEQRELARRQAVARPEGTVPTDVIVEREAARSRVVAAVLTLTEPIRTTVLLRFFDDLPPRVIARRLQVPVETVRTRIKRGLAQLRERLDHETQRRDWRAMLLPLAGQGLDLAIGPTITGVLWMSAQTKLALFAAGCVGALVWLWWPEGTPTVDPAVTAAASSTPTTATAALPENQAAPATTLPAPGERTAVGSAVTAPTGSLRIQLVWAADRQPAATVLVTLLPRGADPQLDELQATSDADGIVEFTGLAPGSWRPRVHRGDEQSGPRTEIKPGERTEITMPVDAGMHVRGVVVDAQDRPIAAAAVVVAGWGGGTCRRIGTSGADGTFVVRHIATHCHIGAIAPGHAPSPMHQFTAQVGAENELRIVLGDGAALTGVVLDPRQQPVADALVRIGSTEQRHHKLADGRDAMAPQPQVVRTDAQGRFHAAAVTPGPLPVAVRAADLAPWQQTIEAATGTTQSLTIHLQAGVSLQGLVRDDRGQPVAKAEVSIGEWDDIGQRGLVTGDDGAFACTGLAIGELKVRVATDTGKAETTLHGAPGQTLRWDPVLTAGLELRGRVVLENGNATDHVMIDAHAEDSPDIRWGAFANTDAEGRFVLRNCPPGRTLHLTFRRMSVFPELVLRGVVVGAEELVVTLPAMTPVFLEGKVLDPDGKPLPNVHASPSILGDGGSPAETVDPATGTFRYGPYPPGEYTLHFRADGFPPVSVPYRAVAAGETWNLGELRFTRGGRVAISIVGPGGMLPDDLSVTLLEPAGRARARVDLKDGTVVSDLLPPGSYFAQLTHPTLTAARQQFEIVAGAQAQVALHATGGVPTTIRLNEALVGIGAAVATISNSTGRTIATCSIWNSRSGFTTTLALPAGEYRLSVDQRQRSGVANLTVAEPSSAVDVTLRDR
ncbi:MAG: sigma-70 family RNA polymerase sigma factor [Planctomycetes bacterium]|nr:sigma-70 family RNA polymerase sigma factor [Planctomycetota bacterium]